MSNRQTNLIVLLLYLLVVPAAVFFYFTSPDMGYPKSTAGIISGVLALVGVALLPVVLRQKTSGAETGEELPTKSSWVVFLGFLIVMAGVVTYFMMKDE
jgi:hypothetical protein